MSSVPQSLQRALEPFPQQGLSVSPAVSFPFLMAQAKSTHPAFLHHRWQGKTHYFSPEQARSIVERETFLDRKTAFALALDTGARVGEMVKVSLEHFDVVDVEQGKMLLWDSKKGGWKTVPLSRATIDAVRLYANASKKRGLLWDVTERTLNNWLQEACTREDIRPDAGRRIRWHSFRGTFVRTHKGNGDKWLMQVTGDSYQTLLSYYEDLTEADLIRIKHEGGEPGGGL